MLINFFRRLFGFEDLDKRIRILERKNYWREKYKHGISKFKPTSDLL